MKQRGDFTPEVRLLWISLLAVVIGLLCAVVALVLLWLIGLFTNLFYYQNLSRLPPSPARPPRTEDRSWRFPQACEEVAGSVLGQRGGGMVRGEIPRRAWYVSGR